jgi:hypothetical protein
MELDRSFGPTEFGPVKQGYGKVDRRGIQAAQRVFEAKFLFTEHLAAATLKQLEKDFLIKLPRAVLIGISQGRAAWGADAQVLQLPLAASEAASYFPESMGSSELAEEHGDKLPPAAKTFCSTLGSGLFDRLKEIGFGNKL